MTTESAAKGTESYGTVSAVRCGSYASDELAGALVGVMEPFGGMQSFVSPGDRVLIKPNLLSAKGPERAITTHPNLVEAVAFLVRSCGAEPLVGDSPGGAIRGIERVWKNTGMQEMAERNGLELINFEASGLEEVISGSYTFHIARPVLEADVIINMPKLKTHTLTLLTCGIKNIFGTIPGFRKAGMHKKYPKPAEFSRMLVELFGLVKPALTIVDAVTAMEGNGPSSGSPRKIGLLLASPDAVAVDAVAGDLVGFRRGQIDTTSMADEAGIGTAELGRIRIVGDGAGVRPEGFELPSNRGMRLIPGPLARMMAPLVWLKLEIDPGRCTRCRLCLDSCPVKTIEDRNGVIAVKHEKCIQCMCCHELCPECAIDIRMSLLARLIT